MTQAHDSTLPPKGKHLTPAEMHKIEAYKAEGYANRQIAKLLGPLSANHPQCHQDRFCPSKTSEEILRKDLYLL